jgi:hypothetical protein
LRSNNSNASILLAHKLEAYATLENLCVLCEELKETEFRILITGTPALGEYEYENYKFNNSSPAGRQRFCGR